MSILSFLSAAVAPVANLIDELHTSDDEKGQLQLQFTALTNQITSQVIALEGKLLEARQNIIVAEAQSQSWITRNWRPITMLTLLFMIVSDGYGWLSSPLPDDAWTVIKLGLGGYVAGRSIEKVAPSIVAAIKK
jgi:hypothetical protein